MEVEIQIHYLTGLPGFHFLDEQISNNRIFLNLKNTEKTGKKKKQVKSPIIPSPIFFLISKVTEVLPSQPSNPIPQKQPLLTV